MGSLSDRGGAGDGPGPSKGGFAYNGPSNGDAGRATAGGFLLDALRHRPAGRYVLSGIVGLLFLSGAGLFTYPFFTDLYTERVVQDRLEDEFGQAEPQNFGDWKASLEEGGALTRITIPAIGVETVVVEGTSSDALRAGAGHYPNTPLPGQQGNVAIAGHRTTYGKPFNQLDKLREGNVIWLSTPIGDFRYDVVMPPEDLTEGGVVKAGNGDPTPVYITHPTDWQVIKPTGVPSLTLTTCHPKGSAAQRLVIRAELAAKLPPGYYAQQVKGQGQQEGSEQQAASDGYARAA